MSKTKKIISMLLVIAMVLTVAPVSVLASAAGSVTYGNVTFVGNEFTVDTSATTEVIRVAAGTGSFSKGTSVTPATKSGIPQNTGSYASVGYGGETPEIPTIRFTIKGVQPDEIPVPTAEGASLTINDGRLVSSNASTKTYTYEWQISAGTASAGNNVVYEITYKISGKTYTAYAFSHVEDILVMNGFAHHKNKKKDDTGSVNSRHGLIVQIQSHNMYSAMCPDSSVSNRKVGYINYATTAAWSGDALLGCGSEADFDSTTNAYGSVAPNDAITGEEVPALIKSVTESSGSRYNMCYGVDSNRGQPKIYLDTGSGQTFRDINLRLTVQNAEKANFSDATIAGLYIYSGKQSGAERDAPAASTLSSSILNASNYNAGSTGSNKISGTDVAQYIMVQFSGTGPSTPAAGNTGTANYYSLGVDLTSNSSGNTNNTAGWINLEVYSYDKRDLRGVINAINAGNAATYICQSNAYAGSSLVFDKGVQPQESYFSSGWAAFETAYKNAYGVLVKPDTNQSEIDTAALNLYNAYQGLGGFNKEVSLVVKHTNVTTGQQVAPAQVFTNLSESDVRANASAYGLDLNVGFVIAGSAHTAGSVATANIATLEGYNPSGKQVDTITLAGSKAVETITFNYNPKSYNVIAYTNNDNGDQSVLPYAYDSLVDVDAIPYGTKANYVFDGWYYDNGVWSQPVTDFTIGSTNVVIYAKWITAPIEIFAIPVVDGTQLAEQKVGQISPSADSAAKFARPADLNIEGYLFVEYYADAALATPITWPLTFNLGDPVKHTIYARMVDVNGKIVFESNGGSAVEDLPFTAGTPVNAPADPAREGYAFAGWYKDRECTEAQKITWPVTQPTQTGFIAYAKWTAEDVKIEFGLDDPTSKFDTAEIPYIIGPANSEIPAEDYPPVPRKFGYIFDHWVDSATGKTFEFKDGASFSTKNIVLAPIWRGTSYSAFIGLDSYEKLSGQYVETYAPGTNENGAKIQVGDTVTVRMTSQANFHVGSSAFVFMYDHNFFELVGVDATAFTLNENNEYVSGINAKIQGVTNLAIGNWPESMKAMSGQYTAMLLTIDPTVTASDYNTEPMSDGEWLVEFQFKVKDTASGSGTVFMDNAWTRNADNPMGTMFYGWSEDSVPVLETYNNVVTPELADASATVYLDETAPVDVEIIANPNGGTWADGSTVSKTYKGRAETEIEGFELPVREGYTLSNVWQTADGSDTWSAGYYGKETQEGKEFLAQWTANTYTISYYKNVGTDDAPAVLHWTTSALYGEAYAAPPANPTKSGYDFGGWVDINGNEAPAVTPMDGIDLYPNWVAKAVTYSIVANYINNATGNVTTNSSTKMTGYTDQTVMFVETVPANPVDGVVYITPADLPDVIANYYVYDTENNDENYGQTIKVAADGSSVINVNYVAIPITFTYDANGGVFTDNRTQLTETKGYLSTAVGPDETPTREGHDFKGWGVSATTTSTTTIGRMQKDTTYYAVWAAASRPVNFDANGGYFDGDTSVTVKSKNVEFGKEITEISQPVKPGYDFLGWATTADATATEALGTMDTLDDAGKTFYAVYKLHDYTVTFEVYYEDSGDLYSTESNTAVKMGDTVTVPAAPAVEGYDFGGWMMGDTVLEVGSTFTMGSADVIITANLSPKTYTVTFDGTGGYFNGDETILSVEASTVYKTSIQKPANPVRQGYEFLGWTATEGSTDIANISTLETANDVTYYAVWKATFAKYYVVTYEMNLDGEYVEVERIENTGNVEETVSTTHTSKTGFTPDLEKSELEKVVAADGSTELKVYYKRNQYTVKTDVEGTITESAPYYHGAEVQAPEVPVKEGHTFAGWTLKSGQSVEFPMNIVGDLEIIAVFNKNLYHVTFYKDETMTDVITDFDNYYGEVIDAPTANKEGYSFVAWKDANNNTVDFANGTVTIPANDVSYYATWQINQYTITFGNTYETAIDPITQDYGTAIIAPADPVREGYTFTGWSPAIPETMPARDQRINATWQINTYTITFDANGGTVVNPADYTSNETYVVTGSYNSDVLAPEEEPTREGYTFTGWDVEVPATMPAEDMTITAQWTINQYTITFDTNGGTAVDAITQDYATDVTAPADPTKTGYTFAGWNAEIPATMPAEDMTITALWTINQYTITFNTDGGTGIAEIKADYNAAVTAPAAPTKTGYTFAGWDKEIPANMPAEDMTITALWTINQYTITFNTDGGNEIAPITQDYATVVVAPAAPTKTGYTFAGWDVEVPAKMPAENVTITAQWTINQYTITFDTDGGSAVDAITQAYDTIVTLPAAPAKEGSTFTGWKRADGSVLAAGETFAMPAADETITAVWDVNVYTLTWVVDGVETSVDYEYGATVETLAEPTKTGYTFTGWDAEIPATMPAKDMTITAQFAINQYTITFVTVGGTEIAPITQDYATVIVAPEEPTKTGYTFAGWDIEVPATMPAEDMTITAQWTINSYNVTFLDADGNVFGNVLTLEFGAEINVPAEAPVKEYYTFEGWSLDGANVTDDLGTVPAEDVVIVSIFTKNAVTLALIGETVDIDTDIKETGKNNIDNALLKGYISGLDTRLKASKLDEYLTVEGDGRLEYIVTKYNVAGTGTVVNVYDRNDTPDDIADDILVEQYIIVIFGDVNGDANIDATDYSIVTDNNLGLADWAFYDDSVGATNENYNHAMVLAANLNGDATVDGTDAQIINDVSLWVAEINQQTGDVIYY